MRSTRPGLERVVWTHGRSLYRREPLGRGGAGWCSEWRLHRHRGVTMRHSANKTVLKAPCNPTRRVGCSIFGLERVARSYRRFTFRHEPLRGGATLWRLHRHEGVPMDLTVDSSVLKALWGHTWRVGSSRSSLKRLKGTHNRYSYRHEPLQQRPE